MKTKCTRGIIYFIGLIVLALGIVLNTKTLLGVSPIISIPYNICHIWHLNLGAITFVFYCFCVLIEAILKGKEFKLYELDVTEIISKEELIEKINELKFEKNDLIEIILVGKRNFEIDRYELYKLISNDKIIKIKNKTKINYDLEKIANETTLKGLFAKEMLEKLNNENISNEEKEIIEKAVEIGMEALGI